MVLAGLGGEGGDAELSLRMELDVGASWGAPPLPVLEDLALFKSAGGSNIVRCLLLVC
jgi:hypothetical protein